jgi:nucleoside-diphosphate-sugar epimerase
MYYRDAGRAIIDLACAPLESIQTVNYLVDGVKPTPTIGELAEAVRQKIPAAQIDFAPDAQLQSLLDQMIRPLDDSRARAEWGWQPTYDRTAIIEDFLAGLKNHSKMEG